MKYRNDEEGLNTVILSGRIISKLNFHKHIEIVGDNEVELEACEFLIKHQVKFKDSNIFRLFTTDKEAIKKIKKLASKGSRIFVQGYLNSRKRTYEQRNKLGLELYTVDIIVTKIINVIDTIYDLYNKEERKAIRSGYQNEVDNGKYPSFVDFDNHY